MNFKALLCKQFMYMKELCQFCMKNYKAGDNAVNYCQDRVQPYRWFLLFTIIISEMATTFTEGFQQRTRSKLGYNSFFMYLPYFIAHDDKSIMQLRFYIGRRFQKFHSRQIYRKIKTVIVCTYCNVKAYQVPAYCRLLVSNTFFT